MKILLINNHHSKIGGAETVYLNTIDLLLENGHEVITLSRKNKNTVKTKAKEYFIDYSNSFYERLYSSNAKRAIQEIIKVEKPDIAHIHNIIGGVTFSILPVLKKHKVPIVITVHDYRLHCPVCNFNNDKNMICEKCKGGKYYNCITDNCSPSGFFRSVSISTESYLRDLFFPFHDYFDKFVFVSDFAQQKFSKIDKRSLVKSERIYNFSELGECSTQNENYFLFLGRLTKEKGVLTLLKAFKEEPSLKLKILGSGYLKKELMEKKSENVDILGFKTGAELKELVMKSYFVIVPSEWYENNPMSIVESFALGKPVIGSDIGGISELIIDKENGFKFEAGNYLALRHALANCGDLTKFDYKRICENAYNFASENFSKDVHYKKLFSTYSELLNRTFVI